MASSKITFLFHLSTAVWMLFGWNGVDQLRSHAWISKQYGQHLQLFTIQGLIIAFITMALSLVYDIFPKARFMHTLKRVLMTVSMPVSIVITCVYWSLMLFSPNLILQRIPGTTEPSSSNETPAMVYVPFPIDIAIHAVPAMALVLDFWFYERSYSVRAARMSPVTCILFSGWYIWWVERCAEFNKGVFPYPFLTENPFEIRLLIYLTVTLIAILSFLGMNLMHHRLIGRA